VFACVINEFGGKTVLVTGAGGFIGSPLTELMVELKARVHALVHYNVLRLHLSLGKSYSTPSIPNE
jgi:FlaA1/EpsC-like NDP-sugar epimerase